MLALLFLASCKGLRAVRDEKLTIVPNSPLYFSDPEKTIVQTLIDGKPYDMMLDTGSSVTLLYSSTHPIPESKKLSKISYRDFNGDKAGLIQKFVADTVTTRSFIYNGKILFSLPASKKACTLKTFDGLMSRPIAPKGYFTELNYEEGYIRFVENIDLTQYESVPAKYNVNQGRFEITMEVNGIKANFLFDTGNSAGIYLDDKEFSLPEPVEQISYYSLFAGNKETALKSSLYLLPVKIGKYTFDQYAALNSSKTHNNVGMKFISQFCWVLDQTNNIAYCKPIHPEKFKTGSTHTRRANFVYADVFNSKLLIAQMNYNDPDIAVGDEITSISGENVTMDNLCEMASRFNSMPLDKSKIVLIRNVMH